MSFRDKVIINKPHYKVHVRKWEKMGSETASEDFDRLHDEQQGREDERGMQQIELPDIYKRKREFTGKRSINGVQEQNQITIEQAGAKRRRILAKTPAAKAEEFQVPFVALAPIAATGPSGFAASVVNASGTPDGCNVSGNFATAPSTKPYKGCPSSARHKSESAGSRRSKAVEPNEQDAVVKVKAPKKVKPVDTLQVPDSKLFSDDAEKLVSKQFQDIKKS